MTSSLAVQEVEFNGSALMAVKAHDDKVYVGVSWVCDGIGFGKNGKDTQVKKIQTDIVLKEGCVKFEAGVFDSDNETIAIELNYLPLWLAKISITPNMQKENPEVVENLIEYQLKAKDVLAKVFIEKTPFILPQSYTEALEHLLESVKEKAKLEETIEKQKPMVEFHDNVAESTNADSIINLGKSFGIGKHKFLQFLRSVGILFLQDGINIPKQQYQNQGYFEVKITVDDQNNEKETSYKTIVTGKGKTYLHKVIQRFGGGQVINSLTLSKIDEHVKQKYKEIMSDKSS